MALLVQLLLSLDRRDLAQTTYQTAKKIGNDSRLVQAIEAWIGLKTVSLLYIPCLPGDPHWFYGAASPRLLTDL